MKVKQKFVYALVSRQYIGEDSILFVSNSPKAVQEWYDFYMKYSPSLVMDIIKTKYYEVFK